MSAEPMARLRLPCAVLALRCDGELVTGIEYLPPDTPECAPRTAFARRVCAELRRYVDDPSFRYTVPCRLDGTAHQRRVWRAIAAIAPGRTTSYGELAARLRSSARAVGGACGANPVPPIVPCHRVLAAGGRLGGFMGGHDAFALSVKRWLLAHEGVPGY
jgi:methylated-DNA-[protein]-cysteine S-methyltransferase